MWPHHLLRPHHDHDGHDGVDVGDDADDIYAEQRGYPKMCSYVPCVLVARGSQGVQEGLPGMTPIFQQARIIWTLGCHDTAFPQPSGIIWTTCSTMLIIVIIMLRLQVFKRDLHHVVNMGCILGGRIIAQPPDVHLLQHLYCHLCFVQICAHLYQQNGHC